MKYVRFATAILVLLAGVTSYGFTEKRQRDNVWTLARQADRVVMVDVTSVDTNITVTIDQILKGQKRETTITFPSPPRPVLQQMRISCPAPRSWDFSPGEKWVLFLGKTEDQYTFIDGQKNRLVETIEAVRQCLDIETLTNDEEKVRRLVQIVANPSSISSYPAFLTLEALNKPEFLDLLTPLSENTAYRWAYISLLQGNESPKATDLLRVMLHTENGDDLRKVVDAVGRKDQSNEEISKELLPFLNHTNPVIRQTSVFVLNYRDYHNGFSNIVTALDDPDPGVRASALAWPWYAYANEHSEVKAKIKKLRDDDDANVRDAAKRALAGMSVWYRLWYYHR